MKIAIATDDKVNIANHFGRCKGFIIFEIKDNKIISKNYKENNFTKHTKGENFFKGIDVHNVIIENLKDCNVVISKGMGQRLYHDLKNNNIIPVITDENNVDKAVELYIKNQLKDNKDKACNE